LIAVRSATPCWRTADNQIQIAHNVHIGKHTAMAGCVGVAGSTRIGAYCTFGGSAMILGHLDIADKVNVMAGTLVGKSILKAGTYVGQYPVQSHEDWLANAAHLRRLDGMAARLKELERKVGRFDADQGE
jgi:UDP-3-O-[3-hydroxymyristoyl] glucosamine N-acyltransferase